MSSWASITVCKNPTTLTKVRKGSCQYLATLGGKRMPGLARRWKNDIDCNRGPTLIGLAS